MENKDLENSENQKSSSGIWVVLLFLFLFAAVIVLGMLS